MKTSDLKQGCSTSKLSWIRGIRSLRSSHLDFNKIYLARLSLRRVIIRRATLFLSLRGALVILSLRFRRKISSLNSLRETSSFQRHRKLKLNWLFILKSVSGWELNLSRSSLRSRSWFRIRTLSLELLLMNLPLLKRLSDTRSWSSKEKGKSQENFTSNLSNSSKCRVPRWKTKRKKVLKNLRNS